MNVSWELQYDGSSNGIRESNSLLSNSLKFSGSDYSLGIIFVNKASKKKKQTNEQLLNLCQLIICPLVHFY